MFQNLKIFQMSQAMAQHAASRHAVVAQNVANADTPNYKAKDLKSFATSYELADQTIGLKATRQGHVQNSGHNFSKTAQLQSFTSQSESLDGNSVSLETEMVKSIEAQRQHDRAISIYKSSLTLLRSSLGRA